MRLDLDLISLCSSCQPSLSTFIQTDFDLRKDFCLRQELDLKQDYNIRQDSDLRQDFDFDLKQTLI